MRPTRGGRCPCWLAPIRVAFLIVLAGTTLEVLTERTRRRWRITRWRAKVAGQVVIVGYGSKGRAVVRTLTESGTLPGSIVIIDTCEDAIAEANAAGLVAMGGDGTLRGVLEQAQAGIAGQVVIAVAGTTPPC